MDKQWRDLLYRLVNNPYASEPSPIAVCGSLRLYIDPEEFCPYYFDITTGGSSWDRPAGWDDDVAVVAPLAILTGLHADGPSAYERKWCVYKDPKYWLQFFVNAATGETRWCPPAELSSAVIGGYGAGISWSEEEGEELQSAGRVSGGADATAHGVGVGSSPMKGDQVHPHRSRRRSSLGDAGSMLVKSRLASLSQSVGESSDVARVGPGQALVRDWMILLDRGTGVLYYAHATDGLVQWEVPSDVLLADPSEWERLPDSAPVPPALGQDAGEQAEADPQQPVLSPPAQVSQDQASAQWHTNTKTDSGAVTQTDAADMTAAFVATAATGELAPAAVHPSSPVHGVSPVRPSTARPGTANKPVVSTSHPSGPVSLQALFSHILGHEGSSKEDAMPVWLTMGAPEPPAKAPATQVCEPEVAGDADIALSALTLPGRNQESILGAVHGDEGTSIAVPEQEDTTPVVERSAAEMMSAFADAAGMDMEEASTTADSQPGGQVAWANKKVAELAARIKALEAEAALLDDDDDGEGGKGKGEGQGTQRVVDKEALAARAARRAAILGELRSKRSQADKLRSWLTEQKRQAAAAARKSTAQAMERVLAEQAAALEARRKEIALQRARAAQASKAKDGVLAARRASVVAAKEAQQALEERTRRETEAAAKAVKDKTAARRASLTGTMPGEGALAGATGAGAGTGTVARGLAGSIAAARRSSLVGSTAGPLTK